MNISATLAAVSLFASLATAQPDTIYHSGNIYTANDEKPTAQAIAIEGDRITAIGPNNRVVGLAGPDTELIDLDDRTVLPGLIDCHTHLCFGGWRGDEFEMRLQGRSYQDIAAAGGGIRSTVVATRSDSATSLQEKALHALKANRAKLRLTGKTRLFKKDVFRFLEGIQGDPYDLAFADPPFNAGQLAEMQQPSTTNLAGEGPAPSAVALRSTVRFSPEPTAVSRLSASTKGTETRWTSAPMSSLLPTGNACTLANCTIGTRGVLRDH